LHAEYLRLQTYALNMQYLLLSHCSNGHVNEPCCNVAIHTVTFFVLELHVTFLTENLVLSKSRNEAEFQEPEISLWCS